MHYACGPPPYLVMCWGCSTLFVCVCLMPSTFIFSFVFPLFIRLFHLRLEPSLTRSSEFTGCCVLVLHWWLESGPVSTPLGFLLVQIQIVIFFNFFVFSFVKRKERVHLVVLAVKATVQSRRGRIGSTKRVETMNDQYLSMRIVFLILHFQNDL